MEGRTILRLTAGFTIIELLIVVILIGLITAIAVPRVDITRYRMDAGLRTVSTSLFAAQRRAVSAQHDVVISFDETNHLIRIHDDANNNGLVDVGERSRAVALGEHVLIARGMTPAHPLGSASVTFTKMSGGLRSVTFHRNGSTSERGGIYLTSVRALTSVDHASDTKFFEIERATGRVSWYRYATQWMRGF